MRRKYIDIYRSLSSSELVKLLHEPQADFKPEAYVELARAAAERGIPVTPANQGPEAASGTILHTRPAYPVATRPVAEKPREQPRQKEWEQPPRGFSSFDVRYRELKELDRTIQELKSCGREDTETRTRIEELERTGKRGWHDLYIDIINREG